MPASHSSHNGDGVKPSFPAKKRGQPRGRIPRPDLKPRDDMPVDWADLLYCDECDGRVPPPKFRVEDEYQFRRAAAGASVRRKWAEQDALREAKLEAQRKAKWEAEAPQRAAELEERLYDMQIRQRLYDREKAEVEAWMASPEYQIQEEVWRQVHEQRQCGYHEMSDAEYERQESNAEGVPSYGEEAPRKRRSRKKPNKVKPAVANQPAKKEGKYEL